MGTSAKTKSAAFIFLALAFLAACSGSSTSKDVQEQYDPYYPPDDFVVQADPGSTTETTPGDDGLTVDATNEETTTTPPDSGPEPDTSTDDGGPSPCPSIDNWYTDFEVVEPVDDLKTICQKFKAHGESLPLEQGENLVDGDVKLIDLQTGELKPPTAAELADPDLTKRRIIHNYMERQALCNDGSPGVYYYRPGSVNKWVIHLEGGGACRDEEDCLTTRWLSPKEFSRMSSCDQEAAKVRLGILSPYEEENPDFFNWHHVHLEYCSSDTWNANVPAGPWIHPQTGVTEERTWHFRGKRIIGGALEDLMDSERTPEPNLSQATEVIFTGTSAGSGGMRLNVDWVASMLPHAQVCGIADASITNPGSSEPPPSNVMDYLMEVYLAPVADASCYEELCDPYACAKSGYVGFEHASTPLFFQMNQWDTKVNELHDAQTSESIREIIKLQSGGFSHRESNKHVYITTVNWSSGISVGPKDYLYREVFGAWYFDRDIIVGSDGAEKPAFKNLVNEDGTPNSFLYHEKQGGMCGGAYPQ